MILILAALDCNGVMLRPEFERVCMCALVCLSIFNISALGKRPYVTSLMSRSNSTLWKLPPKDVYWIHVQKAGIGKTTREPTTRKDVKHRLTPAIPLSASCRGFCGGSIGSVSEQTLTLSSVSPCWPREKSHSGSEYSLRVSPRCGHVSLWHMALFT